jgi:hypothetical protein
MIHLWNNPPSNRRQSGFALVVTLSLMVLLTLIAVGLLGLSSISLRGASQGAAQSEARANARLALMLAIGGLQNELGPDQRINAPADLTSSGLADGRQRWVGTWDSWPAGAKQRPAPQFRRWLVSGDPQLLGDPSYPTSASDLVTLMGGKSAVMASAPRVALKNGGLAFAVADENAKARLGPALNSGDENLADHLARYQSPPAGHGALPGLEAVPRDDRHLDSITTTRSVDLIPLSETKNIDPSSSYTVWSEGLLTDVRNGGLRKDLSLYFSDPKSGDVTNALYQNGNRGGINFRELRNFHEMSSRLTYNASSFSHPDGGGLNPKVPCLVGVGNEAGAATDPFFAYLRPVVIRGSWHISAFSRPVSAAPNSPFRIFIVIEPIVWLWNPFDVNLVMRPGGHLTVRCWGLPYDFTIRAGTTNKTFHFNAIRANQGDSISMEIGQNSPVVMRPGEVQIFSRGRQATVPLDQFGRFEGKLGWSGTGGFSLDTGIQATASTPVTISMKSSTKRGATSWGLIEFLSYVGTDSNNNYWNGGLMIDRSSWQGELRATDFPGGMFQEVPSKTFSSASNLVEPQPLALFSYLARSEREGSLKSRYLARLNAAAMGFDHQTTDANTLLSLPYEPVMQPLSGGLDRGFDFDDGRGFFGASYKADFGQSHLVTHSVPRERPTSLGSFQHALANGVEKWTFTGPGAGNFHDRILQPSVTQAIGNSFAPPCIAPDKTTGTFNSMPAVDHSWLANDGLWDQWFVSSLADRTAPHVPAEQTGSARDLFVRLAASTGKQQLLPNRHFRYAGSDPEEDTDDLFAGTKPKSDAHLKVASLLRVHGAFNIHSTDPDAWLAMFRSTGGLKVPVEPCQETSSEWETASHPIASLLIPKGPAVKTGDLNDPSSEGQWTGYRDVTDAELKELAVAMVEEVRKRGPFLSLADFVNRRLVTDPELASRGALQAALDRSLNKALEEGGRSSGGGPAQAAFPEADRGSRMTHVPGHVKQADILTTLGSRFTPRSDTFTVRAYGESRNASGQLLASARCEAVIQREAAYIDPTDESDVLPGNLASVANKRFGRSFRVLAFRWIPQLES